MKRLPCLPALLAALILAACGPAPDSGSAPEDESGAERVDAPAEGDLRFRAKIDFDSPGALPPDAQLVAYLIESDLSSGERRLLAHRTAVAPAHTPATIDIDLARKALGAELGYEMSATIVDGEGRVLMSTVANRPPVPALGLRTLSVFNLRLLPVASTPQVDETHRLPGALELACGEWRVDARQVADGTVLLTMDGAERRLRPAVASSGGRFVDNGLELWVNDSGQAMLIQPSQAPQACAQR